MKKYLMEGVGTFLLTLFILLASSNNAGSAMPLAYGVTLTALVFAGAAVSGAHFNPAVSVAALVRGDLERWDFPYYLLAQLLGGGIAAFPSAFLMRCNGTAEIVPQSYDSLCAVFAEALGAFLLSFVYLQVSGQKSGYRSGFPGIAVGMAALAGGLAFGSVCSATFNPAMALGMAISGFITWTDIWPVLIGTLLGAAASGSVSRLVSDDEGE